jgi:hypothetical protein
MGYADRPLEFFLLLCGVPSRDFLEQRKFREHDSGDGVLSGGEGEVGKHEGHESYLWIGSIEAGVAGGGADDGCPW